MSALTLEQRRLALGNCVPGPDLVRMGSWLRSELLATSWARERLRSWAAAGRPTSTPEDVPLYGSDSLAATVRRVFGALPEPVLDYVARGARVVVLDAGIGGLFMGASGARALVLVAPVSAERLDYVLCHELAHCWLEPTHTGAADLASEAAIRVAAESEGTLDHVNELHAASEARADRLARVWLETGRNDDAK